MDEITLWVDGRRVDAGAPAVSAVDHGLTVGDGVFETCAVVDGQAFALTRHLARLDASATGLGLPAPDHDVVRRGVAEVLAAAPSAGRLRITVTAGLGPLGSGRLPGASTVIVAAAQAPGPAPARVARVPWTRNERSAVAGLKTTSYADNVVALARAAEHGADEALLANNAGMLCEGTGSNVFVERHGELLTPPLTSGCLAGITRALVLEWAAESGLPVREAVDDELPWEVLDEVATGSANLMLTSSVRTAVEVVALDGVEIAVGPLTREVTQLYARRAAEDVDP